jgi:hypothetical protein
MAAHVPAFTQHTQLFHRRQKAEIHRHASRNSMHPQGKKLTTLSRRKKLPPKTVKISPRTLWKNKSARNILRIPALGT